MDRAEILRTIREPGNVPVRGAAAGALLDNTDEIERRIRLPLEIADAKRRPAEGGIEEQAVADGREPARLGQDERAAEDPDGLGRDERRVGTARRRTGALAAQRLIVDVQPDLVARRHLPGDARAGILER